MSPCDTGGATKLFVALTGNPNVVDGLGVELFVIRTVPLPLTVN